MLQGLQWNNVFVAGGAVLRCIDAHALGEEVNGNKASDIDIFLYGLSDSDALAKITHIHSVLSQNIARQGKGNVEMVRTKNAVTFVSQYPLRHVQVILRMYRSPGMCR
jgi:hypothetical protein